MANKAYLYVPGVWGGKKHQKEILCSTYDSILVIFYGIIKNCFKTQLLNRKKPTKISYFQKLMLWKFK